MGVDFFNDTYHTVFAFISKIDAMGMAIGLKPKDVRIQTMTQVFFKKSLTCPSNCQIDDCCKLITVSIVRNDNCFGVSLFHTGFRSFLGVWVQVDM